MIGVRPRPPVGGAGSLGGGVTSMPMGGDSAGIGVVATLDPGVRTVSSVTLELVAMSVREAAPRNVYRSAAFSRVSSQMCCRRRASTGMRLGGTGMESSEFDAGESEAGTRVL